MHTSERLRGRPSTVISAESGNSSCGVDLRSAKSMREQSAAQKRASDAADAAKAQGPACIGRTDARRIDQAGAHSCPLSADADPGAENERDQ
jgi:hypothetical protein